MYGIYFFQIFSSSLYRMLHETNDSSKYISQEIETNFRNFPTKIINGKIITTEDDIDTYKEPSPKSRYYQFT